MIVDDDVGQIIAFNSIERARPFHPASSAPITTCSVVTDKMLGQSDSER